jgi:hypothetical protein
MAAAGERLGECPVVEELGVGDGDHRAVFADHRLAAVSAADDAQAPRRQADAITLEGALAVRPAMPQRRGHPPQHAAGRRAGSGEMDQTRDATHDLGRHCTIGLCPEVFSDGAAVPDRSAS